jgi:hypothetical protein
MIYTGLKLCIQQKEKWVRLPQATINKYPTRWSRTFIFVAERLVLPHQIVALRLHLLDVIVILGEGGVQLRLHGGGVLAGLHELFL